MPEAAVTITEPTADGDELSAIDHEEQTAGYQAAYTKLAASESVSADPVGYVTDTPLFVRTQFLNASADPRVKAQLEAVSRQNPLLTGLLA